MDANIGLSVLIAAKDEELSIAEVVQSHFSVLQASQYPINWDIGVLDDGSSDSTFTVLTELQKQFPELKIWHNEKPSGIANAFKQLAENAQYEWIYITSGDGQFLAEGLEKMIQAWFANPIATALPSEPVAPLIKIDFPRTEKRLEGSKTSKFMDFSLIKKIGAITLAPSK